MPSASEFSTDPNANTTIGGKNVAENCSPADINDVERYLAAAMRSLYDQVQGLAGGMPLTGGAFTGDITRQGEGAYLNWVSNSLTEGNVAALPEGSARPTPGAGGYLVFYYS